MRLLYRNELDKACFKHDAAYAKYKDVENRLISDQKLRNSAYDIASNPIYDGYQRGLASMVNKFFDSKVAPLDKKTMSGKGIKNNKILAEELHKPVIKIFNKRKVYLQFKDNIWGVYSEFYNHVFKKWLSDNDIIMYSTFNEGKSVVVERFIRTLKNKLYKHMTAINKNVYYVLDDIVN